MDHGTDSGGFQGKLAGDATAKIAKQQKIMQIYMLLDNHAR